MSDAHAELLTAPIPKASEMTGWSKSTIYRAAADGHIILLKHGTRTLVDMRSVRDYIATLPRMMPKSAF